MKEQRLARYWINQPSTSQSSHKLHGQLVLAPEILDAAFVTVYFISGPVISARLESNCLSQGWPFHLTPITK